MILVNFLNLKITPLTDISEANEQLSMVSLHLFGGHERRREVQLEWRYYSLQTCLAKISLCLSVRINM